MTHRALFQIRTAIMALCLFTLSTGAGFADEAPALENVVFAGGCFWCVESDFDKVAGVKETVSGFTGGHVNNPSYKQVTRGGTGHIESVRITFDPAVVSFERLVHLFWRSVDPTDAGGQFCDRGESYTTAIFVTSSQQHEIAEASKAGLTASSALKKPVVTPIHTLTTFWPVERYHQDYYNKKPLRYRYYRKSCGRDKQVKVLWGKEAWAAK